MLRPALLTGGALGGLATAARATTAFARASAVLRVLVWLLLWSTCLRALGAGVGLWAAGTLSTGTTLLVAVVAPAWLFVCCPSWLAFRVLPRLGLRPALVRPLALALCWLSPLVRARDLRSIHVFLGVAADLPFPPGDRLPADAWTALAAALQAERQGTVARAEAIVEALLYLPPGGRFPWLARLHGVEALVRAAMARGDRAAAGRHAQIGGGRLLRLWELFLRGEGGEPLRRSELWLRWLLAPERVGSFRRVRALAARQVASLSVTPPPTERALGGREEDGGADPRLRHLLVLAAIARGERLPMPAVLALAAAWQEALAEPALADLRARAGVLAVRDSAEELGRLREAVLDELSVMAAGAQGALPAAPSEGSLAAELASRGRDRLFALVKAALQPLAPDRAAAVHPLEAWERWLSLRSALERSEQQLGRAALTALWHGGVRDAVWGWACAVLARHGERAGWVTHALFAWLAERAEYLGDVATATINHENARIALRAL